ncbi:MAG TPA: hypothetical protein PK440_08230 [Candidatus Accumulibacter phosphatis]|nr:MAG: hypothetical protein AW07_03749 [Candidatus Accumulibacter sp. SK-11]HAY27211.1 hypothetical protein [Accumulibacter sp.]HCN66782.1 hypothetical protein [Accumulibacter sp.]HRL76504.1 hypothetical protein [Candidatus Accumulibacter phosphatis]HRQ94971.1 hypothetical protein [Candidatus Accumulibacter phosphatis]
MTFAGGVTSVSVRAGDGAGDNDGFSISAYAFGSGAFLATFNSPVFGGANQPEWYTLTVSGLGSIGQIVFLLAVSGSPAASFPRATKLATTPALLAERRSGDGRRSKRKLARQAPSRAEGWRVLLARFRGSGLSVGEFCNTRGSVMPARFHRWRGRLGLNAADQGEAVVPILSTGA